MKHTLWSRLIFCYLILVLAVFIILNSYGMSLLENRLKKDQVNLLFKEASLITNAYRGDLFEENSSFDDISSQFNCINSYLNIRVWIVCLLYTSPSPRDS